LITLLGPSGCGKTTTLRMIAGFEFPTQGEILLDGQAINMLPPHQREMSMVFQSYAIFPHLNVYENVAYGLNVKHVPKEEITRRVDEVLSLVQLTGFEHRAPNQLSGGQQQRVAVARAMVSEPAIILADEPTANLDSATSGALLDMMRTLNQDTGMTFVFSTHDGSVMERARRLIILKDGRIDSDTSRE